MEEKRTSIFENGLIWFGAGVSIAEILTGTYIAPLGFGKVTLSAARCCFSRDLSAAECAKALWRPSS